MTVRTRTWLKAEFLGRDPRDWHDDILDSVYIRHEAITVGTDGTGYDVIFYGDTEGSYFHWDADTCRLNLIGAAALFKQGDFSSVTAGSGVALSASVTSAMRVYVDDGGTTIASANQKGIWGRFLVTANPGDCTLEGILGQIKYASGVTCSADFQAGIRGYLELVGGNTVNTGGANANIGAGAFAVRGLITVDDNTTIAASHYMCAFHAGLSVKDTYSITQTGVLAAYGVFADDQLGGATPTDRWGYAFYVPDAVVDSGIHLGTCATGINIAAATTVGINIVTGQVTGINIAGTCSTAGITMGALATGGQALVASWTGVPDEANAVTAAIVSVTATSTNIATHDNDLLIGYYAVVAATTNDQANNILIGYDGLVRSDKNADSLFGGRFEVRFNDAAGVMDDGCAAVYAILNAAETVTVTAGPATAVWAHFSGDSAITTTDGVASCFFADMDDDIDVGLDFDIANTFTCTTGIELGVTGSGAYTTGILIAGAATGINIGACGTVGISIATGQVTGIDIAGTCSTAGITMGALVTGGQAMTVAWVGIPSEDLAVDAAIFSVTGTSSANGASGDQLIGYYANITTSTGEQPNNILVGFDALVQSEHNIEQMFGGRFEINFSDDTGTVATGCAAVYAVCDVDEAVTVTAGPVTAVWAHWSGDATVVTAETSCFFGDIDDDINQGLTFDVANAQTCTTGIYLGTTGSGTYTTGINIGDCGTGINISGTVDTSAIVIGTADTGPVFTGATPINVAIYSVFTNTSKAAVGRGLYVKTTYAPSTTGKGSMHGIRGQVGMGDGSTHDEATDEYLIGVHGLYLMHGNGILNGAGITVAGVSGHIHTGGTWTAVRVACGLEAKIGLGDVPSGVYTGVYVYQYMGSGLAAGSVLFAHGYYDVGIEFSAADAIGVGIDFGDITTTAIDIGDCTTGIALTGGMADGILISGAMTDNAIEITGTCNSGSAILVTATTIVTALTDIELAVTYTGTTQYQWHDGAKFVVTYTPDGGTGSAYGNALTGMWRENGIITGSLWHKGVHGWLHLDSAANLQHSGIICAIQGEITDAASASITSGNIFILHLACSATNVALTSTSDHCAFIFFDNDAGHGTGGMDSLMQINAWDTPYFLKMDFVNNPGIMDLGTAEGDLCVGHIKVRWNGADAYINVFSDNS